VILALLVVLVVLVVLAVLSYPFHLLYHNPSSVKAEVVNYGVALSYFLEAVTTLSVAGVDIIW
jgi:polyferredoxin